MKLFKKLLLISLCSILVFTSCGGGPGDNLGDLDNQDNQSGLDDQGGGGNPGTVLKFNLKDAKALAAQEKGSEGRYISPNARATEETVGLLVKILDDGSLASVIEFPENYSPEEFVITQIAISPVETSDELYVVVNNGSGYFDVGGLLCVKPDGTYYDILNDLRAGLPNSSYFSLYGNNSDNDYVKFDKLGNMYFQTVTYDANRNTSMIYKYNPKRNESTVLTPAVAGTYYEDYIVSDNGAWIFASANRYINGKNTCYLRAIPTSNAEQYVNITYSSDGQGWYRNLIYDDDNGYLYFNGWVKNNSGIFRIQKKNGTFNSTDLKCMASNGGNNGDFYLWNMIDSEYRNINLSSLLSWAASSEEVIEPKLKANLFSDGEEFVILDNERTLQENELVKAFVKELNLETDSKYNFVYNSGIIKDETNDITVEFKFNLFETIPGYELLAELAKDKTNGEAFKALNTKEALRLLYKLFDHDYYDYYDRYSYNPEVELQIGGRPYDHNFLADITYIAETDDLLCDEKSDCFTMGEAAKNKYFVNRGCLQYIWVESRQWVQYLEWNKEYMSGDEPNYKAILDKLFEYCEPGKRVFTLAAFKDDPTYGDLYTDKENEDALKYITENAKLYLLQDWLWNGGDKKCIEFLKKTCFFADTDEAACTLTGSNSYKWKKDFLNEDGSTNYALILENIFNACKEGEKEFNLKFFKDKPTYKDLYTDKIDEEAIEFISTSEKLGLLNDYVNSSSEGNRLLISNTCFFKGTEDSAVKDATNSSYISWDYSNLKAMAKTTKGIFGSVPGSQWINNQSTYYNTFMKFFDEKGIFLMNTIPDSEKYYATEIQVNGDLMVFKNSVMNDNGDETGSHTIQAFDTLTSQFNDLFEKVDGANIEIISYSVGGGYVYFSGVQGLSLISGKIDLETKVYTPIYSTKKMSQIITVTQ